MIAILAKRWLLLSLGALVCTCAPTPALQAGEKVKVTVVTILATARKEGVDPRLQCIAKEICKKEKCLKGFKLADMKCKSLATGEKWAIPLVDGQEAIVVVHHGADKANRVELKV